MHQYPISEELKHAIRILFDDPSVASGFLGDDSFEDWRETHATSGTTADERTRSLRQKLEAFIVNMAAELDDLGAGELPRLRAEATGLLVSLREIRAHFPRAFSSEHQ